MRIQNPGPIQPTKKRKKKKEQILARTISSTAPIEIEEELGVGESDADQQYLSIRLKAEPLTKEGFLLNES